MKKQCIRSPDYRFQKLTEMLPRKHNKPPRKGLANASAEALQTTSQKHDARLRRGIMHDFPKAHCIK